jgi:hypothetical protein
MCKRPITTAICSVRCRQHKNDGKTLNHQDPRKRASAAHLEPIRASHGGNFQPDMELPLQAVRNAAALLQSLVNFGH